MRNINVKRISETVSELCAEANFNLRKDIRRALGEAVKKEKNKKSKKTIILLLENARIAQKERRALCQDTGLVSVYLDIGRNIHFTGGNLDKAVNEGVKEGYRKAFLRKSVVRSPLLRINTGTNAPAVIHTRVKEGNRIKVTVAPKGFGSENKSRQKMLDPTQGEKEIIAFALETINDAGPDACPPYVVGIGLGGTFDKAASLAKESLVLPIDRPNPKKHLRMLSDKIMTKANKLGIGPLGLGGRTTCLGVNILEYPTHIAGLPVVVNMSCHATRSATRTI